MNVYSGLRGTGRAGVTQRDSKADTSAARMVRPLALLSVCLALAAASGCASSRAVPQPFPAPAAPATAGSSTAESPAAVPPTGANPVVAAALALRGAPYRAGGADPAGFDCSGFVWYVFAREGVAVPRTVAAQFHAGRSVRRADLRPGDLVFFETGQSPASHVGVIVEGEWFVHAPSSKGMVRVERLSAPYWSSRFVGARRLL